MGLTPAGVVWDLGNVLIDWQARAAIAAGVGEDEADRLLAATDFDFLAFNHGPDSGRTWAEAIADVERDHPQWLPHVRAYHAHFPASLVGEVPGSADLLRDLHAAGVPMWGLTNWSHELWPHAPQRFGFLDLLDGVYVSGTEGVAKPDLRAFAAVAERMGLPPERLVFTDDRAGNVEAAIAAGMDGVLFTDAATLRTELRTRGLPV
ncbi:HAD family hydrolase [Nocardioides sp. SYSU D00038]|uniref:HAD family hydrolase n=1 Tax=Nocardioides sp. SYSU D00038 TaxID=2812554 RepID=UPI0019686FD4|nr:HAD family phosphatase [Nocardioides sp. SYSU D00038]